MPLNPKIRSLIETGILIGSAIALALAVGIGIMIYSGGHSNPLVAVSTGSMMPIYNGFQDSDDTAIYPFRGDILLIRKVSVDSIELGDVIVFNTSSVPEPVVHRIVAKWSENGSYFFKTNGDNRDDPDGWVIQGKDIKGVVVLRIPHIGWFLLAFQTLLGRLLLLAGAILILFMGTESEEENDEKNDQKEEHTIVTDNEEKIINDQQKLIQRSFISLENIAKVFKIRNYMYVAIALIIVGLFFVTNLIAVFYSSPSLDIYSYSIENDSIIQNLMDSTDSLPYTIYLPNFSHYQWIQGLNTNKTTFFFPIKLKIQSGGFLSNIHRIDISTYINETLVGVYRWNVVYNYIGTRMFEGGIIAALDGAGTFTTSITINMFSRGFLAPNAKSYTFPLILQI